MRDPLIAEHPDDILTAAYLDGALEPRERDRFEAHLAQCDLCRDGVTLLRSAEGPDPAVPAELLRRARSASGRRGGISRRGWFFSLAASLLLVAGVTAVVLRARSGAPEAGSAVRGAAAAAFSSLSPSGGAPVPASQLLFRWSAVEGADRYEVSVFDASGRKIGQVHSAGAALSAPWPPDVPQPSPGSYVWKIRAMALDRPIADSDPIPFQIRP